MSQNIAITTRNNLRKAIKKGRTECFAVVANIEKIIDEVLWDYLNLPGDTIAEQLYALITLSDNEGGLNCELNQFYALISVSKDVERKVRAIVNEAEQGKRNDLKPENKVGAIIPKLKKPRGASESNKASDRAAERAAKAVPQLDELLNEGLVSKRNAAKIGQVIKDPDHLTDKEQEIIQQREQLRNELEQIIPDPLPEEPQERKKLQKEVQKVIEKTTGKVTPPKISLGDDPKKVAEAIAKANGDLEYLQDLIMELELVTESMQPSLQVA